MQNRVEQGRPLWGILSIFPAPLLLLRAICNHSFKFQATKKIGLDGSAIGHSKAEATVPTAALGRHKAALQGEHGLDKKSEYFTKGYQVRFYRSISVSQPK